MGRILLCQPNNTILSPSALRYKREAKMLCKKIVNFFSLLSHSQDMARQPQTGVGEELLSSVTGLAHYLKVLIRVTLTSALRLVCISCHWFDGMCMLLNGVSLHFYR
jgi:hypothetical protein